MNTPEITPTDMPTPPATPAPYVKSPSLASKLALMALQCLLLLIGAGTVWMLAFDRERTSSEVAESISTEWGGNLYIQGPSVVPQGDTGVAQGVHPASFDCEASVASLTLHRNIYQAEVFDADITLSGTFSRAELLERSESPMILELYMPADHNCKPGPLTVAGKQVAWTRVNNTLQARIDPARLPETIKFSTTLKVRGSGMISVNRTARRSSIVIRGEASYPSFGGCALPDKRSIVGRNFYARWDSDVSAQQLAAKDDNNVTTEFLVGVDSYRKVSRSLKYSIIIVILTFIMVLVTEIRTRRRIPLINYLLIGAALILFYVLLLAFAELIPFGYAYAIAAAMTVALIAVYLWRMLDSKSVGITAAVILSTLYASCYVMLCVDTYALLLGSIILFTALAISMYYSLKIR